MFPSTLSTFNRPNTTDRLNSPSHSALHNTVSSALGQVETVIGVEGANSVVGSLQYLIKSSASDGGGHIQSANKGGTGQSSYTKGDVLVAQSSSVLTKLSVGTDGQFLMASSVTSTGIKWQSLAQNPTVRVYSTSPSVLTWVKPSVLSYVVIEVQAGGAGGGGTTDSDVACGGGGAGGYSRKVIAESALSAAVTVYVGGGGAGGVGSGNNTGTVGGDSGFGSVLVASGGAGGASGTGVSAGGSGGSATGGDINITGGGGSYGMETGTTDIGFGGKGGDAVLGFGGYSIAVSGNSGSNGAGANGYGGGGSGAINANSASDRDGGNGAGGIIIITEY